MSLQDRLASLISVIGADVKDIGSRTITKDFSFAGALSLYTGQATWINSTGRTLTLVNAIASVGTAPTGSSVIVDVNKNGTTIFTTQANRPTIAIAGKSSGKKTPDVTTLADGDSLTIDIDQIGSTIAGSDLTVSITVR